jgi:hypothetical protein
MFAAAPDTRQGQPRNVSAPSASRPSAVNMPTGTLAYHRVEATAQGPTDYPHSPVRDRSWHPGSEIRGPA